MISICTGGKLQDLVLFLRNFAWIERRRRLCLEGGIASLIVGIAIKSGAEFVLFVVTGDDILVRLLFSICPCPYNSR